MADSQLYTQEAAMAKAAVIKTTLALAKLRLYKSTLVPTQFTTKDDLVAAECDFDGYTAGGYTLTAWLGPAPNPGGGAVITSPSVYPNNNTPSDPPVGNQCGGFWIETAAGLVWLVGIFNPSRALLTVGDGFPIIQQIIEAKNAPVSTDV